MTRNFIRVFVFAIAVSLAAVVCAGPPQNDSCSNAIDIVVGTITGDTSEATNDGSAFCGTSSTGPDVWFRFIPTQTGSYTFSLCDSSFDTVLSIHTACPGTPDNEIACNDDACGLLSQVTLSLNADSAYLFRVAGYGAALGAFSLTLTEEVLPTPTPPPAPMNLNATDGSFEDRIEVSWSAIEGAAVYQIWRLTNGDSLWQDLGSTSETTFDDFTAQIGIFYLYQLYAANAFGWSGPSNMDSGFRPLPPPTGLNATRGDFADKISISWNPSEGATSYVVFRATSGDPYYTQLLTTELSYIDDFSPHLSTLYYYAVRAMNGLIWSSLSEYDTGYLYLPPPPAPTGLSATDGALTDRIRIKWHPSADATTFQLERKMDENSHWESLSFVYSYFYNDFTAEPDVRYLYRVRTYGEFDPSEYSEADIGFRAPLQVPTPTADPRPTPLLLSEPLRRYGAGSLTSGMISPLGNIIATAGSQGILLWAARSGFFLKFIPAPDHSIAALDFSPDGKSILTGGADGTAKLWDVSTGRSVRTFIGHAAKINAVDYSNDGNLIATAGNDQRVRIWDVNSGQEIRSIPGDSSRFVTLSPDSSQVVTKNGFYNTLDGNLIRPWPNFGGEPRAAAYSHDGLRVALSGSDCGVFDATTGNLIFITHPIFTRWINSIAFSPDDSKLFFGGEDDGDITAAMVDAQTGNVDLLLHASNPAVTQVCFSPEGDLLLATGSDGMVNIFDGITGKLTHHFAGFFPKGKTSMIISRTGDSAYTASSGSQFTFKWDVSEGVIAAQFDRLEDAYREIDSLALSPDERTVVLSGIDIVFGPMVESWDILTSQRRWRRLAQHGCCAFEPALAYSPDGSLVLFSGLLGFSGSSQSELLEASSGSLIHTFTGHAGPVTSVAFSPDGYFCLTGSSDSTSILWSATMFEELRLLTGHSAGINTVAFSPNGSNILTGSDDLSARLWDAMSGEQIRSFDGHTSGVLTLAFSPSGARVLTGGDDGTARLWDTATGVELRRFVGQGSSITSVAYMPDEIRVMTASNDGSVFLREIDPPRAILLAGGDPNPKANSLTVQARELTAYGYNVLVRSGYPKSSVRILSSFFDGDFKVPIDGDSDGLDDTFGAASLANLRASLIDWMNEGAVAGRRIFLYLVDHGLRQGGETYFQLNACEYISSSELDALLDELQDPNQNGGLRHEVTVVVECCYSGQFTIRCAPTPGQRRAVISSTGPEAEAVLLPPPNLTSFSQQFFGSAFLGAPVSKAFQSAATFFNQFSLANQHPMLVDDHPTTIGMGVASGFLSTSYQFAGSGIALDFFGKLGNAAVSPSGLLSPGTTVTLTVDVTGLTDPLAIYAEVRPPAPATQSSTPVTQLPTLDLIETSPRHWEGHFMVTEEGTYAFGLYGRFEGARRSKPEVVYANVIEANPEESRPLIALLVAGQDDPSGQTGPIDLQAINLTARAFHTATARQYPMDQIILLGPTLLAAQNTNTPRTPDLSQFTSALAELTAGRPGARLFISLIGPADDGENFQIAPGQTINPSQLDSLLDLLQLADPELEIKLLIDAPHAGRYRSSLDAPKRFLILGTSATGEGFFLPESDQSFSRRFLEASRQGRDLYDSYNAGKDFAGLFHLPEPILSDGSGRPVALGAVGKFLGRKGVFASDAGELATICRVAPDQSGVNISQVEIYADLAGGMQPDRVTVQAVRDPPVYLTSEAPMIDLEQSSPGSIRWSLPASRMLDLFTTFGTWQISYEASYPSTDEHLPRLSQTSITRIHILGTNEPAPASSVARWSFYD